LVATALAQQPTPELSFDTITLTDGNKLQGLVVAEQNGQVHFQLRTRRPGLRTLISDVVFDRTEIASLVKAPEPGRSQTRRVFEALRSATQREADAARQIPLQPAPWITGTGTSWQYRGQFFHLQSDAEEPFVRLVCARLNDMAAAYVKTVRARVPDPKPTRILLFRSMTGFRDWQLKRGITLLNPAVYDARTNEVVVGCDLERIARTKEELHLDHERKLKELAEERKKLDEHYNRQPPLSQLRHLAQLRTRLREADLENEEIFTRLEAAFYATLYHEAFHAYLDNAVFPSSRYEVPRWLNEGLAQLFENAFVEIGELNPGRIDEKRLLDIQDAVRRGRFMTLREVLQAPPEQFFVRHTREKFEADRQYDASWALAHFLTYQLKVLDGDAARLTMYVSKGRPPGQEQLAFEKLVGMDLETCQKAWHHYLLRLRIDGTVRPH
jgi:hypothetical protein